MHSYFFLDAESQLLVVVGKKRGKIKNRSTIVYLLEGETAMHVDFMLQKALLKTMSFSNSYFYYIRKTCPCKIYSIIPHFYTEKLGFAGVNLYNVCSKT